MIQRRIRGGESHKMRKPTINQHKHTEKQIEREGEKENNKKNY